ncbi:MAG: glycosyltransferase family 4 protein [Vicinamibacterales bacterium]
MKVTLYIEHGVGNGVGGAELMMAHLASAWSQDHDVTLVHHRPPLTHERFAAFTADDLSRVRIRSLPREPDPPAPANPWRRYQAARDWHRAVSEGADLFVACTHWLPPFCRATHGVLLVLFPFYVRPPDMAGMRALPWLRRWRHRAYYDAEWRARLATYQQRVTISPFAQRWTRARWGVDAAVVPPPVDVAFASRAKRPQILSVGRFSTMAHTKKQREMARVFRDLAEGGLSGWRYACVGGLNDRAENHAYFDEVRASLEGFPAEVAANLPPATLRGLFEESSIFWHATGFGDDTDHRPELAEHFGISTVEAMAAGCVPVVVNKGGQRDLVEHGRTGFVWDTLEELARFTRLLMDDEALRTRLAGAAREEGRRYARPRFVSRMSEVCGVPRPADAGAPLETVTPGMETVTPGADTRGGAVPDGPPRAASAYWTR